MNATELRELSDDELKAKLAELTEERFRLRLPLRDRVDRQPDAVPDAAPGHRADPDGPARARGQVEGRDDHGRDETTTTRAAAEDPHRAS